MAGLGGFFGYALGGINWDVTTIGESKTDATDKPTYVY